MGVSHEHQLAPLIQLVREAADESIKFMKTAEDLLGNVEGEADFARGVFASSVVNSSLYLRERITIERIAIEDEIISSLAELHDLAKCAEDDAQKVLLSPA